MVKVIYTGEIFKGFSTIERPYGDYELTNIELVKRDLLNEIMTRKGDRRRLPNFGSIVWSLIFEPLTPGVSEIIEEDIRGIINRDTRVVPVDISIEEFEHGFTVDVTLEYVPTGTMDRFIATFDRRISSGADTTTLK